MAPHTSTTGEPAMTNLAERQEIRRQGGGLAVAERFYGADQRTWPTGVEEMPMASTTKSDMRGELALAGTRQFMLAGHAIFTVVSLKTSARFTYKVSTPEHPDPDRGPVHFVSVLTGSDNENDYQFVGTIFGERDYRHSRKTRISEQAPSVQAFTWFWRQLLAGANLDGKVKVYHEGRCGRCGRTLTVPESVESGFGPDCRDKMGM